MTAIIFQLNETTKSVAPSGALLPDEPFLVYSECNADAGLRDVLLAKTTSFELTGEESRKLILYGSTVRSVRRPLISTRKQVEYTFARTKAKCAAIQPADCPIAADVVITACKRMS